MLNSRKLRNALALGGLLVLGAASSFAQTSCSVFSTPVSLRPEGLAELTGDIQINCSADSFGPSTSIVVQLNAPVASFGAASIPTATPTTGGAANGTLIPSLPNAISFSFAGVTPTPGGAGLKISGIRVNANAIPQGTTVMAQIIVTTSAFVLTLNPNPTGVGVVLPKSGDFSATPVIWSTCLAASGTGTLTYKEIFSNVLRPMTATAPLTSSEGIGATSGTQIVLTFASIPAGVTISLPSGNSFTLASAPNLTLKAVSGLSDLVTVGNSAVNAATVVYEVTADSNDGASIDTLNFPVSGSYTPGPAVGLGTATVAGNIGPISTLSTAIPRFVTVNTPVNFLTTAPCSTTLLFPYVTNVTGFDTGIAIMNTTADPTLFGTPNQTGPCTLSFYGRNVEDATAPLPAAVTTSSIAAGKLFAWSLANGGDSTPLTRTGFQGYMIAQCNFQLAHGYAFISDAGAKTIAHGYLALVLPQNAGTRTPNTPSATIEQLSN